MDSIDSREKTELFFPRARKGGKFNRAKMEKENKASKRYIAFI